MAETRIRRGSRVYVYELENYSDSTGKVKHRNTSYLGVKVTINGEKKIILLGKRLKGFEITKSDRYGDITVLYDLFKKYWRIELLNGLLPRRGLSVGEVLASLAINKIKQLETETSTLIYDITSTYFCATKLSKALLGYNRDDNSVPQI